MSSAVQNISALEHVPFGHASHQFVRDETGNISGFRFVSVNKSLCSILGSTSNYWTENGNESNHPYSHLETQGAWWLEIAALPVGSEWKNMVLLHHSTQRMYEVYFYRAEGDMFFSIWHASSEQRNENSPDVQVLAKKLERLERFVDSSSDSIQVSDIEGRMVYVNKEGAHRLGIDPKEIGRFKVADFEPLFKNAETWEQHISDLRGGPMQIASENYHSAFQQHIPVEVNVTIEHIQGQDFVVALSRNISDRLATQRELERHASMLEILTKLASEYINLPVEEVEQHIQRSLEELGSFVGADRVYIFEYNFDQGTCKNTFEWCNEGISPEIENLQEVPLDLIPQWVEKHQSGEAFIVEEVEWLPDDLKGLREILEAQGIISLITVPMKETGGRLLGFLGFDSVREKKIYNNRERQILDVFASMLVNIRMRTETEARMNAAIQEARSASKAKSEFLANMSHEIRTPLNGVIGFVELLRSTPLSASQIEFVDNTYISARTLLDLINDILDFSKIEAGKLELDTQPSSLLTLTEQALDIVKFESAKKGLELLFDYDFNLPEIIETDALRLKQVLVNLLSNAIKFTRLGEVMLRISGHCEEENCVVLFEVHDTGIGISHEQQAKMFQAFSQADTSTTRRFGGTGLGLAISSFLVQKMGGQISISSSLGHGSVFSFELKFQSSAQKAKSKFANMALQGKTAWIIQNHMGSAQITRSKLEVMGLQSNVFFVENWNAEDLQKAMADVAADIVILDHDLGLYSGSEIIEKLAGWGGNDWLNMPSIMLYPSNMELGNKPEVKTKGYHCQLSKPIKTKELEECLMWVFNKQVQEKSDAPQEVEKPVTQILPSNVRPVVMLVDDVPMNLTLARWMVEKMVPGVRILEARSGEAALLIYNEGVKANLIFMDVQMPDMDGLETTRKIREKENESGLGHHVPIVALTAGALQEEKERCLAAGMDDFLTKPIHTNQLELMIRKYLQKG